MALLRSPQPQGEIFANVNTNLKYMKFYGFDYDYTLAAYKPAIKRPSQRPRRPLRAARYGCFAAPALPGGNTNPPPTRPCAQR